MRGFKPEPAMSLAQQRQQLMTESSKLNTEKEKPGL
jgi:hypothetical protein